MITILVIDDDSEYRQMIEEMLKSAGYGILGAGDGEEGLLLYREKRPDLIITDLIMPCKEGIGLIMEIKNEFPEAKIIAISGGGRSGPDTMLRAAKVLGAQFTIKKPFERAKLLGKVEECLTT